MHVCSLFFSLSHLVRICHKKQLPHASVIPAPALCARSISIRNYTRTTFPGFFLLIFRLLSLSGRKMLRASFVFVCCACERSVGFISSESKTALSCATAASFFSGFMARLMGFAVLYFACSLERKGNRSARADCL